MVDVEFEYEYKIENNTITLNVYNTRRSDLIIEDKNGVDITEYVWHSNRKLYNKIEDEFFEKEEQIKEEQRYEGGHFDEDAWKGYD